MNIFQIGSIVGVIALAVKNEVAKKNPPKIVYCEKLRGNYNAITIPPFGIYILESECNNTLLLEHELIHWEQYKRLGLIGYYLEYAVQFNHYGYDLMPMEIEARINEDEAIKVNYTEAVRQGIAKTVYNPNFRI